MFRYDPIFIKRKSTELYFVKDTFEKVSRLIEILKFINTNIYLKGKLALKGGTAINLTIFNLPRLSVDIDLDYLISNNRSQMLLDREIINKTIHNYLLSEGYYYNPKSKSPYSLDSWVYNFNNTSGNKDSIKIEINYSLRSHVLESKESLIVNDYFSEKLTIRVLDPLEIYASKINALLNRAKARDLYDVQNMIVSKIFNDVETQLLKKVIIFYAAISSKEKNIDINTKRIDSITFRNIKTELYPVIKSNEKFNLDETKAIVKSYLDNLLILSEDEKIFLREFSSGSYIPELLFMDQPILDRIMTHPMALWKTNK